MTACLLGIASPLLLGFLLVRMLAPGSGTVVSLFLGAGLGAGLVSCEFFVARVAGFPAIGLEALCLSGVVWLYYRRRPLSLVNSHAYEPWSTLDKVLGCAFAITAVAAILGFEATAFAQPHGYWDAWAMWNTKARFLATPWWRWALTVEMNRTHPDYPLLLPGFIARIWSVSGGRELAAPILAAFLFTFATAGVLVGSLVVLKGRSQGFLAGTLLLATPFFISHGAAQYADVPEGFFVLAVISLAAFSAHSRETKAGFTILLGLALGLATWTKNEGWIVLIGFAGVRGLLFLQSRDWAEARRFGKLVAAGLAPVLVIVLCFKRVLAPPNWNIEYRPDKFLLLLTDPSRYKVLGSALLAAQSDFGSNGLTGCIVVFVVYAICAGSDGTYRSTVRSSSGTLVLVLAGYCLTMIVASADINWQVSTALYRLLLQLFPAALFTGFLALRPPGNLLASLRSKKQPEV